MPFCVCIDMNSFESVTSARILCVWFGEILICVRDVEIPSEWEHKIVWSERQELKFFCFVSLLCIEMGSNQFEYPTLTLIDTYSCHYKIQLGTFILRSNTHCSFEAWYVHETFGAIHYRNSPMWISFDRFIFFFFTVAINHNFLFLIL